VLPELERWVTFAVGGSLLPLVVLLVVSLIRLDRRSAAARVADALRMLEEARESLSDARADYDEDRRRWRDDVAALRSELAMERQRCDRLEARVNTLVAAMRENGMSWPG
jgi:chromosome segregation ATPase